MDAEVLVVGEALMDVVDRGGPVVEHPGGSAANVALGLGRLGVRTELLTHVADDDRSRRLVEHLEASSVRVLPESRSAARASTAVATIGASGAAEYVFDVSWALPDALPKATAPVLHIGPFPAFLSPLDRLDELIGAVSAREVTFDPNIRPALLGPAETVVPRFEEIARRATVVKLSDEDAAWLYPGVAPDALLDRLLGWGAALAIVTRGADGLLLATADHRLAVGAVPITVVDTIGAGDTVMASTIRSVVALGSAGLSAEQLHGLADDARAAAAVTASRAGADLPWAAELR